MRDASHYLPIYTLRHTALTLRHQALTFSQPCAKAFERWCSRFLHVCSSCGTCMAV